MEISKCSASQGLSLLKSLGAGTSHSILDDRREHFEPRLENGEARLNSMLRLVRAAGGTGKANGSAAVLARLEARQKWQKRGRGILPLIMKWLRR